MIYDQFNLIKLCYLKLMFKNIWLKTILLKRYTEDAVSFYHNI